MKYFCLIPARGGSKGILKKNVRLLAGRPLIHYTLNAALECFNPMDIFVSTDDSEIRKVTEQSGIRVPALRPKELATDRSSTEEVIKYVITEQVKPFDYEFIILLQPTSPLRNAGHIKAAMELVDADTEMIVSVKTTKANPYYVLFEENEEGVLCPVKSSNFDRRQDLPAVYELNGAIYIINTALFLKKGLSGLMKKKYHMDELSSVDIDTPFDWKFAEFILTSDVDLKLN